MDRVCAMYYAAKMSTSFDEWNSYFNILLDESPGEAVKIDKQGKQPQNAMQGETEPGD